MLIPLLVALAWAQDPSWVVASSPRNARIVAFKMPGPSEPHTLVETGLDRPEGLAADLGRMILYVADPGARVVLGFPLTLVNEKLMADEPETVADNVDCHWVAVDSVGNLFYTDELANKIMKLPVPEAGLRGSDSKPVALYTADDTNKVSAPAGVAVDNFMVLWTNKQLGTQAGSVAGGYSTPPSSDKGAAVRPVSTVTDRAYGVCLARDNAIFTSSEKYVYGVRKTGGVVAMISDTMQKPRGCAWDGEGTVYVADKGSGKIFAFPGSVASMTKQPMVKVAELEDVYGLAVVVSSSWRQLTGTLVAVVISGWFL